MRMTEQEILENSKIIDSAGHIKCTERLTEWVENRAEIQFAIDQLEDRSWQLREKDLGYVALYVTPSEWDMDLISKSN
jgi:hypothetical protein